MQDGENLLATFFISLFDWVGDVVFLTNVALGDSFLIRGYRCVTDSRQVPTIGIKGDLPLEVLLLPNGVEDKGMVRHGFIVS